ncbi:MAG: UbiD family decarboxylase [Nitrospinota bacterium]
MAKDLRTFIDRVQEMQPEGIRRVTREVSPEFEISAILRKLQQRGENPLVIFERVKGSDIPVVTNVIAEDKRVALALEAPEEEALWTFIRREENRIPPRTVKDGPVKERVLTGDDVDLYRLPIPTQCEKDGGAYVTAGVTIVRDPDTGAFNSGIYRQMLHEKNLLGMCFGTHAHIGHCYRKMESQGKGLPAVTYIGHHPVCLMGSQSRVPFGEDEMAVMGGLVEEPIDLVPCETVDLMVPAYSEIAIEGFIRPYERRWEGPFGEYTRCYGYARNSPVFEVTAITHREKPYYQDLFSVSPEHHLATRLGREAVLYQKVRASCPSVLDVSMPLSGMCRLAAYVQIDKQFDGEAKMAALAALASDVFVKLAVIVDKDVNVRNEEEVLWAVATRTQPDQDTFFVANSMSSRLDPSGYSVWNRHERNGMNTKWAIDATKPVEAPFEELADVPKEELDRINLGDYFEDLKQADARS